ncbi:MAG: T9SS type A sorting domain-containing protein [Bacteroidetes bacterium]|nr:T9SS type A sorting domain-containing protein [Bacteroidota bacterium]
MTYRNLIFTFIILTASSQLFSQVGLPALPNTSAFNSCMPDTSGYKKITVGATSGRDYSDLQSAINAADLGTVIILDAGESFTGGFTLPNKTAGKGWIIITSSRMDLLPLEEKRINPNGLTGNSSFPTQASAMAKIITKHTSGIPCFKTDANAHHYRIMGLEITADTAVHNSYGLINLGDGSTAQNSLSLVPDHFVIDRCYIHGHTNATIMKFGVRLDCANAAIIDCYISDFHSIGYDAQAIAGVNGPGPFKIINNYLEASGENILFGGAAASISGLVPSDIEIRQNYFYKPFSWRVGNPKYDGKHWTIKNLFELKTGMRVLLDGNIFENCWADLPIGQSGYGILLTIRTEGGGSPQADVSDITISNNIIRHVGAGISLSGSDGGAGIKSKRIRIYNNLFEDINGPMYGDTNWAAPNDGTFLQMGEPKDVIIDHNTIFQTGSITWAYRVMSGFVYTNNLSNSFVSKGGYQGIYGAGYSHGNSVMKYYFPDITDSNQRFHKNILIGGVAAKYTNYSTLSTNYFPTDVSKIGFVNYDSGVVNYHNYALLNTSAFYNSATDKSAIGVNFSKLDSAFVASRVCLKTQNGVEANEIKNLHLEVYPNPSSNVLNILGFNNENEKIYYKIFDASGRNILSGNYGKNGIDISKLSKGIYIIKVIQGKEFLLSKFVVLK